MFCLIYTTTVHYCIICSDDTDKHYIDGLITLIKKDATKIYKALDIPTPKNPDKVHQKIAKFAWHSYKDRLFNQGFMYALRLMYFLVCVHL